MQLSVEGLQIVRGGRLVLDNVGFNLAAGAGLVLTGPNGVGKTTLLRCLASLIRPQAGSIRLEGGLADTDIGQQAHVVGHLNGIRASLSVAENLSFWSRFLSGAAHPGAIEAALNQLNLAPLAGVPAGYLSAGQKRRLGLARLVVVERPLWLLDEPTVSLDTASISLLDQLLARHLSAGGLAVIATHVAMGVSGLRQLELTHPVVPA
jgi:heme exporter protein A